MKMDRIEYYSDEEIQKWMKRFDREPPNVMNLKGIPFSYKEILKEWYRREIVKDAKKED